MPFYFLLIYNKKEPLMTLEIVVLLIV